MCTVMQGTIKALQLLEEERQRKKRLRQEHLRMEAALRGDDPDEAMLRQTREREISKKRAEFEENRRQRHLEIVAKLLEEETVKKKGCKMAEKAHWKGRWPRESGTRQRERSQQRGAVKTRHAEGDGGVNPVISDREGVIERDDKRDFGSSSEDEGCDGDEGERRERDFDDETLAQPEIDGLWTLPTHTETGLKKLLEEKQEEDREEEDVGDERRRGRGKRRSKLEQKMLTDVVENLRQSIVKKQITAGREFKVSPLLTQPQK